MSLSTVITFANDTGLSVDLTPPQVAKLESARNNPKKMTTSLPQTHLTLHEDGKYSVIHQGMPTAAPQDLPSCRAVLRRHFPKIETVQIWEASNGEFSADSITLR